MQKMVLTGCLKLMRSHPKIQATSFVLPLTASSFSIYLQNISASTPFLQNVMESGQKKKFTGKQYMICITSVTHMAFVRFGAICGHAGTPQKCGIFGHDQYLHTFHACGQQ